MKKESREFQRLIRMAKLYTGMQELQASLPQPPPLIVELKFSGEEVEDLAQTKSDRQ